MRLLELSVAVFEGSAGASVIDRQVRLTNETTFLWCVAQSLAERGELPPAVLEACRPLADGQHLRDRAAAGLVTRLQFLSQELEKLDPLAHDAPAGSPDHEVMLTVLDTLAVVTESRECLSVSEAELQAWWSSKRTGGPSPLRFAEAQTPSAAMLADALGVRRLAALALALEAARQARTASGSMACKGPLRASIAKCPAAQGPVSRAVF